MFIIILLIGFIYCEYIFKAKCELVILGKFITICLINFWILVWFLVAIICNFSPPKRPTIVILITYLHWWDLSNKITCRQHPENYLISQEFLFDNFKFWLFTHLGSIVHLLISLSANWYNCFNIVWILGYKISWGALSYQRGAQGCWP